MKLLSELLMAIRSIQQEKLSKYQRRALFLVTLLLFTLVYPLLMSQKAHAAFTYAYYRPDRMKSGTAASGAVSGNICVKTSTAGTESTLTWVVPSAWTLDTTTSNYTMDTSATNIPPNTTQWPSTSSGNAASANNGTHTLTFTVGDLSSASTVYCMHITAAGSTTTATAGDNQTGTIATNIDAADTYATSLVSSNDQIAVTATVNQNFSFALSTGTAALGTLTPDTVSSATTITASIGTNATNGYTIYAKDANANGALHSTTASADIAGLGTAGTTVTDLSTAGTNYGYGLGVSTNTIPNSNSAAVNSGYDSTSSTTKVGRLDNATPRPIASAISGTPSGNDVYNLMVRAKISAGQKAASDYADTITVTAAGQF